MVKDLISEKQGKSTTIQDKSGKCLTEEKDILSRCTENCSELYNYASYGDNSSGLQSAPRKRSTANPSRDSLDCSSCTEKGKVCRSCNIPAELVQAGGKSMFDVLTKICNKIWKTGELQAPWTQSLIITPPKKGNLQVCQNYRTISLISHQSKAMLRVILNRLKPLAEEINAE